MLCPDIPQNMFVTCIYIILDPASGYLRFANAGHNLPVHMKEDGVAELRATGMPLGLMPGMSYEETEAQLCPGDGLLVYSDGLVEAHNEDGEMFGFPRLRELLTRQAGEGQRSGEEIIQLLQNQLSDFAGQDWEQEDDVTIVTLEYTEANEAEPLPQASVQAARNWELISEFSLPSEPGNELQAMEKVAGIAKDFGFPEERMERLKTAVAEATMNAMEHGNHYQSELMVEVRVLTSPAALAVRIRDHGGGKAIPEPETPDLEAKLAGQQSPRGWGLFLIKNMVDEMNVESDDVHHTIELIFNLEGKQS
jgi:anti-sigma regulatory factor (Ser/Thr protein kinase)